MIRIVTDSGADIPIDEAKKLGVDIVSLGIHFEGKVYTQEEDTDFSTFYSLLKTAKKLPQTSQPSPEDFAKVYRNAKENGDSVVVIPMSSGLSGTYQSAVIAKDTVQGVPIYTVDAKTVIMGLRILVEHAVKLRAQGHSAEEIAAEIGALGPRVQVFGMLDTLTYLYKGGRLSRTVAIAGNLLHVKPIVAINEEGAIAMVSKGRGYQSMVTFIAEGPAFDPAFPVYFGYADVDDICTKVREQARERFSIENSGVYPIGSMIGTHVGPGCVAIAYVKAQ